MWSLVAQKYKVVTVDYKVGPEKGAWKLTSARVYKFKSVAAIVFDIVAINISTTSPETNKLGSNSRP